MAAILEIRGQILEGAQGKISGKKKVRCAVTEGGKNGEREEKAMSQEDPKPTPKPPIFSLVKRK